MAKLDKVFSKSKQLFEKTTDAVKNTVNNIDVEAMKESVSTVAEKTKSTVVDMKTTMETANLETIKAGSAEMAKKGWDAVKNFNKNQKESEMKAKEILHNKDEFYEKFTANEVAQLLILTFIADQKVSDEEITRLNTIGRSLYENFDQLEQTVRENSVVLQGVSSDEIWGLITNKADAIIESSKQTNQGTVSAKLLIWDLLDVASADGEINSIEKKFIHYIAEKICFDPITLSEMESAATTVLSIQKEIEKLSQSNKPYSVIQARIKTLEERMSVISAGIIELIED